VNDKRYFVLVLMDEPGRGKLGIDPTGGIAAAPAVGRVIERVAPFLGVKRQGPNVPQAIPVEQPPEDPAAAGTDR
jgi:cell division protein FtsI (penicillin-binding protein 3)